MSVDANEAGAERETARAPQGGSARKSAGAFFAITFVLYATAGLAAQRANPIAGLAWSEAFAFLIPAVIAAAGSNLRPASFLLLSRRPTAAQLALGFGLGAAGFLFAGAIMAATASVLPRRWVEAFDLAPLFQGPPAERVALALAASLVAPFCEETAFRGYVLSALRLRARAPVAIAASALLFAVMHVDPVRFPALVVLGFVFGWVAWRAGSLWPAVAAHATNNGIASFLATTGNIDEPVSRPDPVGTAVTLAIGAAALWPLLRAYRKATPAPPPVDEVTVRRDPADPSLRFRLRQVPPLLVAIAALGLGILVLFARAATAR